MYHTPSLMACGSALVISPDGSHRVPPELWGQYAAIVLLEPEPPLLAQWVRDLEAGLGVNDAHRRALDPAPKWYVLRVTSQQERLVVEVLGEKGVTAYAPVQTKWAEKARRKATRSRALMPGYVFACLPDDEAIDIARAPRPVIEIMCNGEGVPRRIPPMLVGSLMLADACHAFDETWTPPKVKGGPRYSHAWKRGQKVRIRGGAFDGFVAEVQRGRGRNQMDVLLTVFGRLTEIAVDHKQLASPN